MHAELKWVPELRRFRFLPSYALLWLLQVTCLALGSTKVHLVRGNTVSKTNRYPFFFLLVNSRSLQHHAIADLKQTGWGHTQTSYSMLLWKMQMPCPWYIKRGLFLCRRVADLSNFIKIRIRLFISMVPDYPRSRPKNSFKKTQKNFLIFLNFFLLFTVCTVLVWGGILPTNHIFLTLIFHKSNLQKTWNFRDPNT